MAGASSRGERRGDGVTRHAAIVAELCRADARIRTRGWRLAAVELLADPDALEVSSDWRIVPDAYAVTEADECGIVSIVTFEVEDTNHLSVNKLLRYARAWFDVDAFDAPVSLRLVTVDRNLELHGIHLQAVALADMRPAGFPGRREKLTTSLLPFCRWESIHDAIDSPIPGAAAEHVWARRLDPRDRILSAEVGFVEDCRVRRRTRELRSVEVSRIAERFTAEDEAVTA